MASKMAKLADFGQCMMRIAAKRAEIMRPYMKELAPPTPGDIPKALAQWKNVANAAGRGAWKEATLAQATTNTLIALEIWMWFFIGECIGKRKIVGYWVDGAVFLESDLH